MKKLITTALLTISLMVNAQDKFNVSVYVDPFASVKEKGIDFGAEIEYNNRTIYTKAGFQSFSVLEGNYTDIAGGIGLNQRLGMFDKFRLYGGVRLGFIFRGSETYPLAGGEGGIDYNINDKWFVGVRGTGDYRTDFDFWGGKSEVRYSGFLRVGMNF
jgi:hypothetical protein